jgi:hypothetical protein
LTAVIRGTFFAEMTGGAGSGLGLNKGRASCSAAVMGYRPFDGREDA